MPHEDLRMHHLAYRQLRIESRYNDLRRRCSSNNSSMGRLAHP